MLEVVSNPWRFTVRNWLCDSDLVSPTGIERVLTKKDLLADSYSDLEASILDEKEFLLLKVISTLPELCCLICSMVGAGLKVISTLPELSFLICSMASIYRFIPK